MQISINKESIKNEKETTKAHVLRVLEEGKGTTISGAQLASALSISRSAVWKAISELREDGYCISAATNKGYSLSVQSDVLSPQGIGVHLRHKQLIPLLHIYDSLESTNLTAKQLAVAGAPHGTTVVAATQTAGRGRLGRSFHSPKDAGVYLSIILRPVSPDSPLPSGLHSTADAMLLTAAASVAAARAIEQTSGKRVLIKWVNDLYLDGKKICGILTEGITGFESGTIESIVIGIGINCFASAEDLPSELQEIVGTLTDDPLAAFTKNALIANLLDQLMDIQGELEEGDFIKEYKHRSCVLGREILIFPTGAGMLPSLTEDAAQTATAVDIDNRGGLVVEFPDKSLKTLSSGEISIRFRK